ncbi:hypothetical protein RX411_08205 [Faecalibacterium prausnitzii]|jgi:hypothetical protein|uniref:hypothetical protein n=1 Tax=Faecalibacterium prausnitzii TaxID=853 RepID=UPI002913830B|nr:hypothetical protein [Faecalibacterium prausnitzii]
MITAKTNDGFEIELDENFLDDAEMIEAMTRLGKDPSAFFVLRDRMLTPENKARLYDHLRNEKGIVPMSALDKALNELLTSFKAGKNSASSPN